MVKGLTRRVVVIKSPDPRIFEEAIFLVREDGAGRTGVTNEEILREARDVAESYVREQNGRRLFAKLPPGACALLGAGGTAVLWLLTECFIL